MRKNKWMKLFFSLGLSMGVMCAGLTGCGKAEDGAGQEQSAADAELQVKEELGEQEDEKDSSDTNGSPDGEDMTKQQESAAEEVEPVSLEGLGISILGDSISTYDGWIPEGFHVYYPFSGDVTDVSQTWWKGLIDDTGMELCANNSSSGSTCAGDSLSIEDPFSGCGDGRLSFLSGSQGRLPDIIIIYMGTNDLLMGIPIGDNDGTKLVEEGTIDNFSDAYCMILDKLASYYPTAQIFCCSLTPVGDWGTDQPYVLFENHLGLTAEDYSAQIQVIADSKGAAVIDLYHCGIEIDNLIEMTTDGTHLTPAGMECVKKAVCTVLTEKVVR